MAVMDCPSLHRSNVQKLSFAPAAVNELKPVAAKELQQLQQLQQTSNSNKQPFISSSRSKGQRPPAPQS